MYKIFEELLKNKNLNAYKVAKATGISSQTFSAWKQGLYTPKREKLQKIADFLGVTVDYLMGRPTLEDEYAKEVAKLRSNKSKIQTVYDELSEENQNALLKFAEYLLYEQNKNRP